MARSPKQRFKQQYLIEKKLAKRLLNADKRKRRALYKQVYDEFFSKFPLPTSNEKSQAKTNFVNGQVHLLKHLVTPKSVFLDIGAGECSLAAAMCKLVKKSFAVDVSETLLKRAHKPKNFEFILSEGVQLPVPKNSINLAFSSQVVEHLHPEDAQSHLSNVHRALAPGGYYVCITPNRLHGPHDISQYFDSVAKGLHLKEYSVSELSTLFSETGFSKVNLFVQIRGDLLTIPILPSRFLESALNPLSYRLRKRIAQLTPMKLLLGIAIIAKK